MISALLLAAGQGSRMGYEAKALLALGETTFVQHALQQLSDAGMDEVILVTGAQRDAVWQAVSQPADTRIPLREAYNPNYPSGILSSIQMGLKVVHPQSEAVLITLVDLPFLSAEDFRTASDHWRRGDAFTLLRSRSAGKPAHPVIIPRAYFSQIMEQPPSDKGCSFLFKQYPERVVFHEVATGRIDIDTIEDYHAHISS
jgi:CTP:molybdopterin cytidylyltransferase MocA